MSCTQRLGSDHSPRGESADDYPGMVTRGGGLEQRGPFRLRGDKTIMAGGDDMATPSEHARLVCGICGATAEELASPLHPPLDGPIVIRTHVLEAHGITVDALEGSVQIGSTWTLPDGQVWMSEVRS